MTARIKYSYLKRRLRLPARQRRRRCQRSGVSAALRPGVRPRQPHAEPGEGDADWSPADSLGISAEYLYKDNNYKDTPLGRTGDTRNEVFVNLTYGLPSSWRMSLFADYEHIKYDSDHRNVGVGACDATTGPNCYDPSAPPSSSSYNWAADRQERRTG